MKGRYKQMKRGTAALPFVLEALSKGQMVVVADDENRETEAAVELARLADLTPAGVLVEILRRDGSAARRPDLLAFCKEHGLLFTTIEALMEYAGVALPCAMAS